MKIHIEETRDVWTLVSLPAPLMVLRKPLMDMERRLRQMPVVSHPRQPGREQAQ